MTARKDSEKPDRSEVQKELEHLVKLIKTRKSALNKMTVDLPDASLLEDNENDD
jgi:hypothetical protein